MALAFSAAAARTFAQRFPVSKGCIKPGKLIFSRRGAEGAEKCKCKPTDGLMKFLHLKIKILNAPVGFKPDLFHNYG